MATGMNTGALVSLGAYFVLMLGIGWYAYRKSTSDMSEYMLGGRQLHPAVAALSAGASDMSGWLLMGLPGALYMTGMSSAWIAVGLVIGAYLNYLLVAPRLRVFTEHADDALTIPDYFEKRFHDKSRALRVISSIVIVIFFTLYTSAGMVAGGKLFEASFGLQYGYGLLLTGGVVVAYTLIGGFLAVSLTDFVQGCIMFLALIIVPVATLHALGGWDEAHHIAISVNPNAFSWLKGTTFLGVVSSMAWGLGYFGQPHIIVRFMAIRSLPDVRTARHIGMTWMLVSLVGAVFVGLFGLAYVQKTGVHLTDPETIFILLSQTLFHPVLAGFLLAAILAAIMSTISSQLLVSSSSLTGDFYKIFLRKDASQKELVFIGRASVLLVAVVAGLLAMDRSSSILSLVGNAWAGFGAAFGPLILLSLYWGGLSRNGALAGMIAGAVTVLFWLYAPVQIGGHSLHQIIYEMVPGFFMSGAVAILVSRFGKGVRPHVSDHYDHLEGKMDG